MLYMLLMPRYRYRFFSAWNIKLNEIKAKKNGETIKLIPRIDWPFEYGAARNSKEDGSRAPFL